MDSQMRNRDTAELGGFSLFLDIQSLSWRLEGQGLELSKSLSIVHTSRDSCWLLDTGWLFPFILSSVWVDFEVRVKKRGRERENAVEIIMPYFQTSGVKLPCFCHMLLIEIITDTCQDWGESKMDAGKTEGKRRRGQQRTRRLDGITGSMDVSLSKLREMVKYRVPGVLQPMGLQIFGHDWATEQNRSHLFWRDIRPDIPLWPLEENT